MTTNSHSNRVITYHIRPDTQSFKSILITKYIPFYEVFYLNYIQFKVPPPLLRTDSTTDTEFLNPLKVKHIYIYMCVCVYVRVYTHTGRETENFSSYCAVNRLRLPLQKSQLGTLYGIPNISPYTLRGHNVEIFDIKPNDTYIVSTGIER
jgi:hypothetical protein